MRSLSQSLKFVRVRPPITFREASQAASSPASSASWTPGSKPHVAAVVRRLSSLFETFGESDYIGEPLSITGHSVQAALIAQAAGEDEEVQLAALLHDVGHLLGLEAGFEPAMDGCGTEDHEGIGADFIRDLGLSDDVAYLAAQHVQAKRYLVWQDPNRELSEASATTLKHQGGPMSDEEAAAAEADPRWPQVLAMRSFDEAAKEPERPMGPRFVERLLQGLVAKNLAKQQQKLTEQQQSTPQSTQQAAAVAPYVVSREQLRRYGEDGFLLIKGALDPSTVKTLPHLADALANAHTTLAALARQQKEEQQRDRPPQPPPPGGENTSSFTAAAAADSAAGGAELPHGILMHHEMTPGTTSAEEGGAKAGGGGRGGGVVRLCRVENFCSAPVEATVTTTGSEGGLGFGWAPICFDVVQSLVSQLYGEPAVLFKDKLNFKAPGGAGFLCHQDATAYATDNLASRHVSAMVAVDAATVANGAVEVAPGRHKEGVFPNEAGVVSAGLEQGMTFEPVLVEPGDVVLFDSYLPHRSSPNTTASSRRLAYLTFSPLSEGDHRLAYYEAKAELMRAGTISINNDFAGVIVD